MRAGIGVEMIEREAAGKAAKVGGGAGAGAEETAEEDSGAYAGAEERSATDGGRAPVEHDQPSGDYETCQHPVAKNRYTSHHVAAVSRPCRERVVSMSRHVATCRERVAGMSRRVASVSRRVAGMLRACRGHVATCRAASCDVTQRRKVSPHRPTQPLAAWPLK